MAVGSCYVLLDGWPSGRASQGWQDSFSTLPWPELFSIDAVPDHAIVRDPDLLAVLIGHYVILAAGGALGLLAGVLFGVGLRRRRPAAAAALLVAAGSGLMGFAAGRRAVDVAVHDGRSTVELEALVWGGGSLVLMGAALLSLALRRDTGRGFLILGLSAPAMITTGIATFAVFGPDAYPTIWGLTFPPPSDYLLAAWFITLGQLARTGRLGP